jgi:hypothetical protein
VTTRIGAGRAALYVFLLLGVIFAIAPMPEAVCRKVYATSGYSGSLSNLARTSLSTDMVFSDDDAIHQLATVTGSVKDGFVGNLTIGI